MQRILLLIIGTLSLGIGIIGIFLPGLPTTPFLLLTAGLYMKSSQRMYNWLYHQKWISRHIIAYQQNKGLSLKNKIFIILLMWSMILIAVMLNSDSVTIMVILTLAGITGTVVMGFIIPTVKSGMNSGESTE